MYAELPDPEESLAALLEGPEPDWEAPPEPPPNEDGVDRLLRRLGRVQATIDRDDEIVTRQMDALVAWREERRFVQNAKRAWLEGSLGAYMAGVWQRRQVATLTLPAGELRARKKPDEWHFDEPTFLAWASESLPAAVRQKPAPAPEIDRNEAKRLLTRRDQHGKAMQLGVTESYEMPPGLTIVPGDRAYTAHPNRSDT